MNRVITRRALVKGGLIAGALIPGAGLFISGSAHADLPALDRMIRPRGAVITLQNRRSPMPIAETARSSRRPGIRVVPARCSRARA